VSFTGDGNFSFTLHPKHLQHFVTEVVDALSATRALAGRRKGKEISE
jgi:hypothetical protein